MLDRRKDELRPPVTHWRAGVFVLVFCLVSQVAGQPGDSLYIDEVIRDVVLHNNRAAAARYMEQAARAKVGPAGAWDDPMLMLGVANLPTSFDFDMDPMTMKMVGLSQNIPYAGQKGLQSKAAQSEADAASEDRRAMEVDLVMAARYAFADLYYRTRSLGDLAAQHDLLEAVVASAKSKLATNQASQDEVLAAQAELWRLQAQLLEAEHMVDESRYNLNILRGLDPVSDALPLAVSSQPEVPQSPDNWLAAARQNYPPLRKLSRQAEAYTFSSRAARRMSWPMLGLSANYGFRTDTEMEDRDNMVGFQATLTLPIFAGRQQRRMAESMEAMRRSVDEEALQLGREIESRLRLLHTTAVHLVQTVDLYGNRIIPITQDAFQSALAGYASNRVPYTNLLMLAVNVYRDRLMLNEVNNQLARTMAEIDRYTVGPAAYSVGAAGASR
ncbi:MAG: TolC family protein [Candidatus Zixiibacteriota bacterium]